MASYTIEVEFIVCYEVSNHRIWLRNFVTELRTVDGIDRPLKLFCGNKSTVLYSNNNKNSTKSKHIDIKFLIVKTNSIIVDLLTKVVSPKMFHEHATRMSVMWLDDAHF